MGRHGRTHRLPSDRSTVCDLLWAARRVPLIPVAKMFDLPELEQLRSRVEPKLSWVVMLMKAYGMVAMRWPQLRQVYLGWPWPRVYQHSDNACFLTISRKFEGADRLFFARFPSPEAVPLPQLQATFERYRTEPVESFRQFRHQIRLSRLPAFVRRLIWRLSALSGSRMVHNAGTFGISMSRVQGAELGYHIAPVTTILGCDAIPEPPGRLRTTITFDHRLIDAWPIGTILIELEAALKQEITREVQGLIAR